MSEFLPIPVTEIVAALEREAGHAYTDPRWIAAQEMRRMVDWESRTLMCAVDVRPKESITSLVHESTEKESKCTCIGRANWRCPVHGDIGVQQEPQSPAKEETKPCRHCGTPTARPNQFCSGYCQEVFHGLS